MLSGFAEHYERRSRRLRHVKTSETLWEIQKYPLPGRPSIHHWVKSKTIIEKHQKFIKIWCFFLSYSVLAGWSTWQWVFLNSLQNFWSFDTPECGCAVIWNRFMPFLLKWLGSLILNKIDPFWTMFSGGTCFEQNWSFLNNVQRWRRAAGSGLHSRQEEVVHVSVSQPQSE